MSSVSLDTHALCADDTNALPSHADWLCLGPEGDVNARPCTIGSRG